MKIIGRFKQHDLESLFLQASIVNQKSGDLNAHAVWLNFLHHPITVQFYVLYDIFLKFSCQRVLTIKPPMGIYKCGNRSKPYPNFYPYFPLILPISAIISVTLLSDPKVPIFFYAFLSFIKFPVHLFHVHAKSIKNWFAFCFLFGHVDNQKKLFITRKTIL